MKRQSQIRNELSRVMDSLDDESMFTSNDIYNMMKNYKHRPNVNSLGKYLREYADVVDHVTINKRRLAVWQKKVVE